MIVEAGRESFGFKKYNSNSKQVVDKRMYRLLKKKKKEMNSKSRLMHWIKKRYGKNGSHTLNQRLKKIKRRINRLNKKISKFKFKI